MLWEVETLICFCSKSDLLFHSNYQSYFRLSTTNVDCVLVMDPNHQGMRPGMSYQPGMPVSNVPIFYQPNPAPTMQPYAGQPIIMAGGYQPQQQMPAYNG